MCMSITNFSGKGQTNLCQKSPVQQAIPTRDRISISLCRLSNAKLSGWPWPLDFLHRSSRRPEEIPASRFNLYTPHFLVSKIIIGYSLAFLFMNYVRYSIVNSRISIDGEWSDFWTKWYEPKDHNVTSHLATTF